MARWWQTALLALALWGWVCPAQGVEPAFLEPDPLGAYLSLRGVVSVAGRGPLPLRELPPGKYDLLAEGPGLPAVKGRIVRTPEGMTGHAWAGPGTLLLPPGFIHLERGETRGWALMGAGAVSIGMTLVSQVLIKEAENDREKAAAAFRESASDSERAIARISLLEATEEKADRMDVRDIWTAYAAATWLGAGLEAALLTPAPTFSSPSPGRYVARLPRAGGFQAAYRSVLIPGAGQRYMGQPGRASSFFTAVATFAAASIASHDAYLEARRDQATAERRIDAALDANAVSQARKDLEEANDRVDRRDLLRWIFAGAAAGAYLWNVYDAFALGHQAEAPALTWSAVPRPDGVLICATWSRP
jgi:hypothetical protein